MTIGTMLKIFYSYRSCIRCLALLFSLACIPSWAAKYPQMSPSDVSQLMTQMTGAHAIYKKFDKELAARSLKLFIDELDPNKIYFLKSDLTQWLSPSETLLQTVVEQVQKGDFDTFKQIIQAMDRAIQRRALLETPIPSDQIDYDPQAFKDVQWAESELALKQRLEQLKAMQQKALLKLDETSRQKAFARVAKARALKEAEIASSSKNDQDSFLYCHFLKAFAASLDTHTSYFTPAEAAAFLVQVQQRLFGIGAQLRDDLNGFTIVKMIEGGPAERGGLLKNNDRIIAINSEPVVGLDITEAVELIRGQEGTVVNLTILRSLADTEMSLDIPVTRGEVVIQEARLSSSTIPFADGVIAVLSLHSFYQDPTHSSATDMLQEITNIRKDHKLKGIIVDLRDNSGGVLPQAIAVTGLFITKGIVASIKDNFGQVEHLREVDGKMAYDGPLMILTSKASASAAEIVAQSLQDYGRAIIVGDEYTFGKGSFQTFSLDGIQAQKINPKGEMKVTRGRYYTVSGKSPQLVGVKPDIVIPGFLAHSKIGEQHNLYPLPSDALSENFQDDLADIPPVQRDQISWLYRFNLQPKMRMYSRFIPQLQENAKKRLASNLAYQKFLEDLKNEKFEEGHFELYLKSDLQLQESVNVMKDLILLLN